MARRWGRVLASADLGKFLADLRVARGWTQTQLADELGVSRRYVYEIESGKPSLYTDRLFATLRLLGAHLVIEADTAERDPVRAGVRASGGR